MKNNTVNQPVWGILLIVFLLISVFSKHSKAQSNLQFSHRLIVLTDMGADPDDEQSLVRLLVYSNAIDIEGIIATTSTHQRKKVVRESIHKIIDAYAEARPNLLKHEKGFPSTEKLHRIVKQGLPVYGMNGVGAEHDSEGSKWIIQALEKNNPRPLWVSVWGGPNTLAQALWKIRATRSKEEADRLISKLRVYAISDQDPSGPWMRKVFPDLFYITSPGGYLTSTWISIGRPHEGANNDVIRNKWIADNIQQDHGPLGAVYPDVAYMMEGDTPSFLSLIPNGLNNAEYPNFGGWGGRYELYIPDVDPASAPGIPNNTPLEGRSIWTDAIDTLRPFRYAEIGRPVRSDTIEYFGNQVSLWRWREDFQYDFAARMDWTVMDYEEANHPPVAWLAHNDTLTVRSGEAFELNACESYDPDGDSISYLWFQYPEAGTYKKLISIGRYPPNLCYLPNIHAPIVEHPETTHFILKVTDKGSPPLSRYKRVIVNSYLKSNISKSLL